MSYLVIPNGIPDFGKAVISFWFRVQRETLESVAAESYEGTNAPRMFGIIPLLVFGKAYNGYQLKSASKGNASYTVTIKSFAGGFDTVITTETQSYSVGSVYAEGTSTDEDPSYIGINCYLDRDTNTVLATLRIRLQTPNLGSGSWVFGTKDIRVSDYNTYAVAGDGAPTQSAYAVEIRECISRADAGAPRVETETNVDQSEVFIQQHGPDSIEVGPTFAENRNDMLEISPDKWHHLLLSFDVMQSTEAKGATSFSAYSCSPTPVQTVNAIRSITDPCKVWLALDDENRTGKSLDDPRWTNPDPEQRIAAGLGDNGVASYYAIYTTFATSEGFSANEWFTTGTRRVHVDSAAGMPTYSYNPALELPSQGYAFGIPGTPELVDRIRHVEMAEFQMWTDVTLDTAIESNRRAFVDENGLPVDPTKATGNDLRWPGERLLGKKPEILLHGDSKWIEGYNTGTLGLFAAGDKNPDGQFQRTAVILPYDPEPVLEESST